MKSVTQEHPMGCGVACVAGALGIKYAEALELVDSSKAWTTGFYCPELKKALSKKGIFYRYKKTSPNDPLLQKNGVIVFVKRCNEYPEGHYLLRTKRGWMNPWINYPCIKPAKSGYQKNLPSEPEWILYPAN